MLLTDFLRDSAKRYPERIAVKSKQRKISFQELDILSSRVAVWLIKEGCSLGDRVGIHLDRSVEGVIAVFGILKAGAAYVPIDITLPPKRKRYLIYDCGIKIILTDSQKISLLGELLKDKVSLDSALLLDSARINIDAYNKFVRVELLNSLDDVQVSNLPCLKESQLANILYTSGSTGLPKGVTITHGSLSECIKNEVNYFGINEKDIVSSTTPLHFSMSPFEIFTSLMSGAALCIVPSGLFSFPVSLTGFIEKEALTIWHSVPSVISQLVLYGNLKRKDFSKLRLVHLAGGPVPIEHMREFMRLFSHIECYNIYGSAETYEIAKYRMNDLSPTANNVPVGQPWKDVEMFLVDDSGKQVSESQGARGELYVKTPSMMEGYWNDRDATEEVLIKSPFHRPEEGTKVYKTRDILKLDKDNNYVLIGRVDNTIKRDGFRIGLSEIEAVLFSHPSIEESAVVVDKGQNKKVIRAVVVLKKNSFMSEGQIREFCRKNLPRYMLPDKVEIRDSLPKTSTGKVDRKII